MGIEKNSRFLLIFEVLIFKSPYGGHSSTSPMEKCGAIRISRGRLEIPKQFVLLERQMAQIPFPLLSHAIVYSVEIRRSRDFGEV